MSDFGRIHAFVVSNKAGNVVYERFYDRLSEIQKAELRTALSQCSRDVVRMPESDVGVGNFRGATIVYQPLGPLVYYCVGSGEYEELTMLSAIQSIVTALQKTCKSDKRYPNEEQLLKKYDKMCITVDEIIHEGILDSLEAEDVYNSVKLKTVQ